MDDFIVTQKSDNEYVDKNGLSNLKSQLSELSKFGSNITPTQLSNMNPGAFQNINKEARKALSGHKGRGYLRPRYNRLINLRRNRS